VAVKTGVPGVVDFTLKVTTPAVVEVPEAAEIVSTAPLLDARVTVLPETGLVVASFKVTVIVEVVEPSAKTAAGAAVTVELAALPVPATKLTVAVCTTIRLSLASVAVKIGAPVVVAFTVKVTTPDESEAPEAAEIVSAAPRLEASVTVLPETPRLLTFFKVTVMVDVEMPLAVTVVGEAATVELAPLVAVVAKATLTVWLTTTLSVVSVAVKTGVPVVADFTLNVTTPVSLEGPEAAEMVSVAPRLEANVTVLPATGLLVASFKVTVMVEVVTPSLATVVGLAATVELAVLAGAAGVVSTIWIPLRLARNGVVQEMTSGVELFRPVMMV